VKKKKLGRSIFLPIPPHVLHLKKNGIDLFLGT